MYEHEEQHGDAGNREGNPRLVLRKVFHVVLQVRLLLLYRLHTLAGEEESAHKQNEGGNRINESCPREGSLTRTIESVHKGGNNGENETIAAQATDLRTDVTVSRYRSTLGRVGRDNAHQRTIRHVNDRVHQTAEQEGNISVDHLQRLAERRCIESKESDDAERNHAEQNPRAETSPTRILTVGNCTDNHIESDVDN